jgi:hypothetical protein
MPRHKPFKVFRIQLVLNGSSWESICRLNGSDIPMCRLASWSKKPKKHNSGPEVFHTVRRVGGGFGETLEVELSR